MEKKLIRLTEQDLHRIVKESVNNIISEIGRSAYTQKKYDQTTRNEIIANAQAEVDRLRAEIANLTKKIRVAQSPEAVEQLNRQRSVLYKLRNRAVAKVWNLSNERVMTQGAKERATVKRRIDKAKANFYPSYNTSTFTEAYIRDVVNESIDRILKEGYYEDMHLNDETNVDECPYCGSNDVYKPKSFGFKSPSTYKCGECGADFDEQDYLDAMHQKWPDGYEI
jgi:DNA-directed RNA polymerase subunit RPC12/RpoP